MSITAEFIETNFKRISVLKENANGRTELVTDTTGAVYIRKIIARTGLPYRKLAQIKCAHIPEIYYSSEAYGKTYVIEEFISGENLAAELEQGKKFTAEQVRNIALQICEALIVLHEDGILHRDIKPGNIIVQGSSVWLIDFGAAKAEGSTKEHDTVILGTPGFAPPEQYGFTTTDARSDIYALGKTMEILCGSSHNAKLCKIIAGCTAFDPQKRIASAAELKKLLLKNNSGKKKFIFIILAMIIACSGVYFLFNRHVQEEVISPGAEQKAEEKVQPEDALQEKPSEQKTEIEQPEQKTKTALPQEQSQSAAANSITLNANNLVFAVNTNPLNETARKQGAQQGLTLLQPEKYPVFTVQNNNGLVMENPTVKIKFTGICAVGNNFAAKAWGGRTLNWQLTKNAAGYADEVRILLTGTIPAGDYFEFPLTGAIADYYQTGSEPAVEVTVSGDNIIPITKNYNIKIN